MTTLPRACAISTEKGYAGFPVGGVELEAGKYDDDDGKRHNIKSTARTSLRRSAVARVICLRRPLPGRERRGVEGDRVGVYEKARLQMFE